MWWKEGSSINIQLEWGKNACFIAANNETTDSEIEYVLLSKKKRIRQKNGNIKHTYISLRI